MKINPILKYLPTRLKDPKIFETIENELKELLRIDHSHKTAVSYSKCEECTEKREKKRVRIKELGFKSLSQYFEWKRVMSLIINNIDKYAGTTSTKGVKKSRKEKV